MSARQATLLFTSTSSMATLKPTSKPIFLKKYSCPNGSNSRRVVCTASGQLKHATKAEPVVERRSGNYMPSVWDYDVLLSSTRNYQGEEHMKEAERLRYDVKNLFNGEKNPLELIDTIQRLGLEYLFEKEIKTALESLYQNSNASWIDEDLYTTALKFRLFRQNGFPVSEDVFEKLKDENGKIKDAFHEDVKTLLTLYDASFLGYEDEPAIDEARRYATKQLENLSQKSDLPKIWSRKIAYALEMPLHWRINRIEARWFMDTYEQEHDKNQSLLDLAKLEYNILQSIHFQEAKELISWWVDMGLNKFEFARDRVLEHYLWVCLMLHEAQFGNFRKALTKITCFISLVDDVYDIYGLLEELELVTDFVDRWDMSRIDELPPPVRKIILAMFNTSNEIGYTSVNERDFNSTPYISKAWADVCNGYLKEANWYNKGHIPTLEQYMSNAVITSTIPLMLLVTYILASETLTKDALAYVQDIPPIVLCCTTIVRLTNDLATSGAELARGDTSKAVQCYMNEAGVSEELSREHITDVIEKTWKIMNKSLIERCPFLDPAFLRACLNLARASHYFYGDADGHGVNPDIGTKDRLMSLVFQSISLPKQAK